MNTAKLKNDIARTAVTVLLSHHTCARKSDVAVAALVGVAPRLVGEVRLSLAAIGQLGRIKGTPPAIEPVAETVGRVRLELALADAERCIAEVSAARDQVPFLIVLEAMVRMALKMLDGRGWSLRMRSRMTRTLISDVAEVWSQYHAATGPKAETPVRPTLLTVR